MLVRDFAKILRRIDFETLSAAEREALTAFLTGLVPLESMNIDSFLALLRPRKSGGQSAAKVAKSSSKEKTTVVSAADVASSLRAVFEDDAAFEQTLMATAANKAATITTFKATFRELFGRDGNFRSKTTRDAIVRKILTERNVAVRDEKMGAMLGRKPVPAD